jgi:uroporphyrin-III C-methyltransferase
VEVGKRGGCPSTPQAFIERLMVREAQAGQRVVRLKGGDPMLFGRAAEELDALRAAGLAVEVVPGVTSALGAAAGLGLSLTDRRAAQGVAFVTGHAKPGGEEADWQSLAASGLTLVVYMGLQRSADIANRLIGGGRPVDTPVALVFDASLPTERHVLTTLGKLRQGHPDAVRGRPGLLVIGDVVQGARAWAECAQAGDVLSGQERTCVAA